MLEGKSVILSLPPSTPWYQTMYRQIEEDLLTEYSSNLPKGMPPAVDRFAFCALASTEGGISQALWPYLAELENIAGSLRRSNGELFRVESITAELRERLWESQLKLIFILPAPDQATGRRVEKGRRPRSGT